MNTSILGIDLAQNYFQVCGLNSVKKVQFNRKLTRKNLVEFMQHQAPTQRTVFICSMKNTLVQFIRQISYFFS